MQDRRFLLWLADRLVLVYGEDEGTDFVCKLVSIAKTIPEAQDTPNTERYERNVSR